MRDVQSSLPITKTALRLEKIRVRNEKMWTNWLFLVTQMASLLNVPSSGLFLVESGNWKGWEFPTFSPFCLAHVLFRFQKITSRAKPTMKKKALQGIRKRLFAPNVAYFGLMDMELWISHTIIKPVVRTLRGKNWSLRDFLLIEKW